MLPVTVVLVSILAYLERENAKSTEIEMQAIELANIASTSAALINAIEASYIETEKDFKSSLPFRPNLKINNTKIPAKEVARIIKKHYRL